MFYPGETDYHIFTLPFSASDISSVLVSYRQKGRVVLEKQAGDYEAVSDSECRVAVSLSQTETMKFVDDEDITIQLNVIGSDGGRSTSIPISVRCGMQYHRQVI